MIRDILSIAPWWFWIFIAPELIMTIIWLICMPFVFGFAYIVERREAKANASSTD